MYRLRTAGEHRACQMRNADRVVPAWEMKVGDQMRMGPQGYPVNQVVALERGRWLLMAGADLKTGIAAPLPQPGQTTYINYTWVLYLDERPDGTTRLISRTRLDLCAAHLRRQTDVGSVHRSDRVRDDAQDAVDPQAACGADAHVATDPRLRPNVGQVSAQGQAAISEKVENRAHGQHLQDHFSRVYDCRGGHPLPASPAQQARDAREEVGREPHQSAGLSRWICWLLPAWRSSR